MRYALVFALVLFLSYSVYLASSPDTIAMLTVEDGVIEWLTAIFFLAASVIFFLLYWKKRHIAILGLAIILFVGFGEEISWGQRIFDIEAPGIQSDNLQNETNFHNLKELNLGRVGLAEIFYYMFMFSLYVILPLVAVHPKVNKLAAKLGIPLFPLWMGAFFILNHVVYKILEPKDFFLHDGLTEIKEMVFACYIMVSAIHLNK